MRFHKANMFWYVSQTPLKQREESQQTYIYVSTARHWQKIWKKGWILGQIAKGGWSHPFIEVHRTVMKPKFQLCSSFRRLNFSALPSHTHTKMPEHWEQPKIYILHPFLVKGDASASSLFLRKFWYLFLTECIFNKLFHQISQMPKCRHIQGRINFLSNRHYIQNRFRKINKADAWGNMV